MEMENNFSENNLGGDHDSAAADQSEEEGEGEDSAGSDISEKLVTAGSSFALLAHEEDYLVWERAYEAQVGKTGDQSAMEKEYFDALKRRLRAEERGSTTGAESGSSEGGGSGPSARLLLSELAAVSKDTDVSHFFGRSGFFGRSLSVFPKRPAIYPPDLHGGDSSGSRSLTVSVLGLHGPASLEYYYSFLGGVYNADRYWSVATSAATGIRGVKKGGGDTDLTLVTPDRLRLLEKINVEAQFYFAYRKCISPEQLIVEFQK